VSRGTARLSALACVLVLAGCGGGRQNALDPHSRPSREIAHLFWIMVAGAGVVFGVVSALLLLAFVRRRRQDAPPHGDGPRSAYAIVIAGGLVWPALTLAALLGYSMTTMAATSAPRAGSTQLTVLVTGHQWWWEVRYPGTRAVTANEIHIPVGERVEVQVRTADVIHSFWVPELNRKIDLIPGRTNRGLLLADRPGVYRGQCAEFCGLQHAHMSLIVVAEPPERFRAWLASQAEPAHATEGPGGKVFRSEACAGCHTIRGTPATGDVGPDLTHLGSRRTLAANTLPNTPERLREWIRDPQHWKPGNRMPSLDLSARDVDGLVSYLQGLK
jgi:cytochrome c oxidase subunit 2